MVVDKKEDCNSITEAVATGFLSNSCSGVIYDSIFNRTSPCMNPEVLRKKTVLKNLAKLIGKHLCQSLFSDDFTGQN